MVDRPTVVATCIERDVRERITQWICQDQTLICRQHYSEQAWSTYRQQHWFCTVSLANGKLPLDVDSSSHAAAIAVFITRHWRGDGPPIVLSEYLV